MLRACEHKALKRYKSVCALGVFRQSRYQWFTFYHFRSDKLRSLTRPSHSKPCYHVTEMPAWAMWFLANCLIFILGPVSSSDVCMSLSDVATVVAELVFNGSSLKASQHTSSDLKPHSGHSWTSVHGWHLSTSGLLCRIVSLEIFSENCSFKNKNKNWMEPLWCQLAMKPCAEHFGCCNLAFSKPDIMSRVWIWVGNRGAHTVVICQSQDGPTGWFCKFWRRA